MLRAKAHDRQERASPLCVREQSFRCTGCLRGQRGGVLSTLSNSQRGASTAAALNVKPSLVHSDVQADTQQGQLCGTPKCSLLNKLKSRYEINNHRNELCKMYTNTQVSKL